MSAEVLSPRARARVWRRRAAAAEILTVTAADIAAFAMSYMYDADRFGVNRSPGTSGSPWPWPGVVGTVHPMLRPAI